MTQSSSGSTIQNEKNTKTNTNNNNNNKDTLALVKFYPLVSESSAYGAILREL